MTFHNSPTSFLTEEHVAISSWTFAFLFFASGGSMMFRLWF